MLICREGGRARGFEFITSSFIYRGQTSIKLDYCFLSLYKHERKVGNSLVPYTVNAYSYIIVEVSRSCRSSIYFFFTSVNHDMS